MAKETFRDVINAALRATRQTVRVADATTEFVDDGSDTLEVALFEMVADALEEIQGKHRWSCYHQLFTVTYAASADSAAVTGAYHDFEILRDPSDPRKILAWDDTAGGSTPPYRLYPHSTWRNLRDQAEDAGIQVSIPSFISVTTDGDAPSIRLFPVPSGERTVKLWAYNPPVRVKPTDSGALDTEISLPARLVRALVVWRASAERGEELGISTSFLQDRYEAALVDEIYADEFRQGAFHHQAFSGTPV